MVTSAKKRGKLYIYYTRGLCLCVVFCGLTNCLDVIKNLKATFNATVMGSAGLDKIVSYIIILYDVFSPVYSCSLS